MKSPTSIKTVHVSALQAELAMPFRVATGEHRGLDNLLLTVTLNDGTVGFGEAAVATHITGETIAQTKATLTKAAAWLKGLDVSDYLALSAQARIHCGANKAALAAIDMAILDALTKYLKMPLWQMWGRVKTPAVFKTDITIVIGSLDETMASAKLFYRQGFRAFKIKIGRDMDLDFKRVCAVRAIVGTSTIILDANQGYTAKDTLAFLKMMGRAGINISLIEQPVAKGDWDGLTAVTRSTRVMVCADESVGSLTQAIRAIKEKAVGAINIKLMKTGVVEAMAIMQLAKAHNIKLMMGGMMESSLAMTASAHLVAAVGGVDFVDLDTPFFIKGAVGRNPYLSTSGQWDLRQAKQGIGVKP